MLDEPISFDSSPANNLVTCLVTGLHNLQKQIHFKFANYSSNLLTAWNVRLFVCFCFGRYGG